MIGEYCMCPDVGCQCVFSVQQLLMFCLVSNWERKNFFVCGSWSFWMGQKPQCITHKACCKDYSKPVYGHVPLQDSDRRSLAGHVDQRPPGIRWCKYTSVLPLLKFRCIHLFVILSLSTVFAFNICIGYRVTKTYVNLRTATGGSSYLILFVY